MILLSKFNFKKKIVATLLAAIVTIVPVTSYLFISHNAFAETLGSLSVGDIVAQYTEATCIKDTKCVKRWHEYVFTLYYEGTYDNVFVSEIIEPKYITAVYNYTYKTEDQLISTYNLSTTLSDKVTTELDIEDKISFSDFLDNAKAHIKVNSSFKHESAVEVTESITYTKSRIIEETYTIKVDGVQCPFKHYYGDMLMMAKANKFRLHVYKQQHAKHRSSALSSWGSYKIEETWDEDYYFYSSYYNTTANFYRMIGDLGTHDEFIKLISNSGK